MKNKNTLWERVSYFIISSILKLTAKRLSKNELISEADMMIERILTSFRNGHVVSTPTIKEKVDFDSVKNATKAMQFVKQELIKEIETGNKIKTSFDVTKYLADNFMKYFTPLENEKFKD